MQKIVLFVFLFIIKVASAQKPATLIILDEAKKSIPYYTINTGKYNIISDSLGKAVVPTNDLGKNLKLHTLYRDTIIVINRDTTIIFKTGLLLDEILVEPDYELSRSKSITVNENIFTSIDYGIAVNQPYEYGKIFVFDKKVNIQSFSIKAFQKELSTQKPIIHIYKYDEFNNIFPIKVQKTLNAILEKRGNWLKFIFENNRIILSPGKYMISVEFLPINKNNRYVKSYWVTLTPDKNSKTLTRNPWHKWSFEIYRGKKLEIVSSLIYNDVLN